MIEISLIIIKNLLPFKKQKEYYIPKKKIKEGYEIDND
jgi:hypothetical protein